MLISIRNRVCSSFLFPSQMKTKAIIMTKKSSVCGRPFADVPNVKHVGTKAFASAAPSSDSRETASNHSKRVLGQDASKKYEELMGASKLQLAPMMEYTDRHFRHLVRLVSRKTLLYTEMVAANALARERDDCMKDYERTAMEDSSRTSPPSRQEIRENYADHYLQRYLSQGHIEPLEGPSVLQLGGSDPKQLYEAAQTVMDMTDRGHCDYTALNLNCGCPSPKVAGKGCFGAALMDEPRLVAELTNALHDGCDGKLPVTVKCRIGTDTDEPFTMEGYAETDPELEYKNVCQFIETVASNSPVTDFQVHARIAVLRKSFSPADNRKIPPLKYDIVRRLATEYPELTFSLNGGIDTLSQAQDQLNQCPELNGIMIGRGFAADPWGFAMADSLLYESGNEEGFTPRNRLEVLTEYVKHADAEEERGDPVKIRRFITKAVQTLFTAEPKAKRYRIALDEIGGMPKKLLREGKNLADQPPLSELILNAAHTHLSEEVLLRTPEESYERKLYDERKSALRAGRSSAVTDWQLERIQQQKENGGGTYEAALAGGETSIRD
ncbi:unnamed protein product [Pseudo-nitzschia multistriata]|uniref:DUS-like FMN-binding domain-containing protein n=1 Tax=Pseudo-nitzschia multistriata TaxID=183589 RepID=A0A448ZD33_9STRA|nr:unnamed protein product [Pseudo-nitzschia multistriata]